MTTLSTPSRRSPLHPLHERLGGRFVEFAGWSMPVQYSGTLAEHTAVRNGVGVFGVSHLGRFALTGAGATNLLRRLLCNDVTRIQPGRTQYTMKPTSSGGVVDDIIGWRWADEDYRVLPNGVNYERVGRAFAEAAPAGVEVDCLQETTTVVAVQGPAAPDLLQEVPGWRPRRFGVDGLEWQGQRLGAAGTGYTGDRRGRGGGPDGRGPNAVRRLHPGRRRRLRVGSARCAAPGDGLPPVGPGPRHRHHPSGGRLGWVVSWEHDFVERPALEAQPDEGLPERMVAFAFRTIPCHGYPLRCGEGRGVVASGTFSPSLGVGIGMGYGSPGPGDSGEVAVEVRGRWVPASRVSLPFLER